MKAKIKCMCIDYLRVYETGGEWTAERCTEVVRGYDAKVTKSAAIRNIPTGEYYTILLGYKATTETIDI